ncbi:hypothetical protein H9L39_11385 [Fusarium oxysporum f. sp. albedinis]|nr:hypothetical protein H9L39_11385 [Fusarium oxysporum f. sp. albedinis]
MIAKCGNIFHTRTSKPPQHNAAYILRRIVLAYYSKCQSSPHIKILLQIKLFNHERPWRNLCFACTSCDGNSWHIHLDPPHGLPVSYLEGFLKLIPSEGAA